MSPAAETVVLLSRKGPELTFTELGSSGEPTGLRTTQRFHGTALSGVLVDAQAQWLYLLQAAPQVSVHKFQLAGREVLPVSNATLRTATADKVLNVWNAVVWESRGAILAMSPSASGLLPQNPNPEILRPWTLAASGLSRLPSSLFFSAWRRVIQKPTQQ